MNSLLFLFFTNIITIFAPQIEFKDKKCLTN